MVLVGVHFHMHVNNTKKYVNTCIYSNKSKSKVLCITEIAAILIVSLTAKSPLISVVSLKTKAAVKGQLIEQRESKQRPGDSAVCWMSTF